MRTGAEPLPRVRLLAGVQQPRQLPPPPRRQPGQPPVELLGVQPDRRGVVPPRRAEPGAARLWASSGSSPPGGGSSPPSGARVARQPARALVHQIAASTPALWTAIR